MSFEQARPSLEEMLAELRAIQANRCDSCGKVKKRLYEVAGLQLCGDCIAPPREGEKKEA